MDTQASSSSDDDIFATPSVFESLRGVHGTETQQTTYDFDPHQPSNVAGTDLQLEFPKLPMTPLHAATAEGNAEEVARLVSEGANPDQRDAGGVTPLFVACRAGSCAVVEALLAAGANAETAASCLHGTLLHAAAANGHADIVRLLLKEAPLQDGVLDPSHGDPWGRIPLVLAASRGHVNAASVLLEHLHTCDNKNYRNYAKKAALHAAAANGQDDCVRLLLANGAELRDDDFEWDVEDGGIAFKALAAGGYRQWQKFPTICPGLEQIFFTVWQRTPDDLPQIFRRCDEHLKRRVRTALLCMRRRLPGVREKQRMQIVQAILSAGRVDEVERPSGRVMHPWQQWQVVF